MSLQLSDGGLERRSGWKIPRRKLIFVVGGAVLIVLIAVMIWFVFRPGTTVPADVIKNYNAKIYIPTKLPGKYRIDESSFRLVEGGEVLIFEAKDDTGSSLVFTEQLRPKDFSFEQFYGAEFKDPKIVNDAPYSATWSELSQERVALSVVTDDAWIMMTTNARLGESDMQRIAQGIKSN